MERATVLFALPGRFFRDFPTRPGPRPRSWPRPRPRGSCCSGRTNWTPFPFRRGHLPRTVTGLYRWVLVPVRAVGVPSVVRSSATGKPQKTRRTPVCGTYAAREIIVHVYRACIPTRYSNKRKAGGGGGDCGVSVGVVVRTRGKKKKKTTRTIRIFR